MEEGRPRRPFSLPSTQYSRPHKGGREEGERGRQAASEEEVVKERQTVRANSVFETCQVEGRGGKAKSDGGGAVPVSGGEGRGRVRGRLESSRGRTLRFGFGPLADLDTVNSRN